MWNASWSCELHEPICSVSLHQDNHMSSQELAALGSAYVLTFMDDVLRRTILRGASSESEGLRDVSRVSRT